jgi:hypothetical protein
MDKLSLLEAFKILNLDPGKVDGPKKSQTMYTPYDRKNESLRYSGLQIKGYSRNKPDMVYGEQFKEVPSLDNIERIQSSTKKPVNMESRRGKLREALLPFIGSILPF